MEVISELNTAQIKDLLRQRIIYLKAYVAAHKKPTYARAIALSEYKSLEVLLEAITAGDMNYWKTK